MRRLPALICASAVAACAAMTPSPAGLKDGKFTSFDCDGGDFQARWNAEGNTVRIRSHHGSAELTAGPDGTFIGDGYQFQPAGKDGTSLSHGGKVVSKNCKKA